MVSLPPVRRRPWLLLVLLVGLLVGAGRSTWAAEGEDAAAKDKPTAAATIDPARLHAITVGEEPQNVDELKALEATIEGVAQKVIPCTVGVQVGGASGSGVIVSEDGLVLTAGHVCGRPGRNVTFILHDGSRVKGKTLGVNSRLDSGMMKIDETKDKDGNVRKWPHCEAGKSGELKRGQWVLTTGHPGGVRPGRSAPVRVGRVLVERSNLIVTDCTLVGGDSGGPLFDLDGKVVGIHSRIGGSIVQNIHVPVDVFHDEWGRLAKGDVIGGPQRGGPYIGVMAAENSDVAKIDEVVKDSPAEKAGIKAGDVVTQVDGKQIKEFSDLAREVGRHKPEDKIKLTIQRGDQTLELEVTIGKLGD